MKGNEFYFEKNVVVFFFNFMKLMFLKYRIDVWCLYYL